MPFLIAAFIMLLCPIKAIALAIHPKTATLAELTISAGTLSPVFATSKTNYTVFETNSHTFVTIIPTLSDPTASLKINSIAATSGVTSAQIPLAVGANTITITVTASDGLSTQIYTITATRAPSANANLAFLKISSGTFSPVFASATTSYFANENVASITATPILTDTTATVTVNGMAVASRTASSPISLNVGPNTVTVRVTAQDGTTAKTYTITVTKAPSCDASLAALKLSSASLSPAFVSSTQSYTAAVTNTTKSITVTPVAEDVTATVMVNGVVVTPGMASPGIPLVIGTNIILTKVMAQDGITSKTYTVTVTRPISSDATLAGLAINKGNLNPAFATDILHYNASVKIAKKDHTIYTMGDSLTANGGYQDQLDSLLKGSFQIINFGIRGDRTDGMVQRFPAVTRNSPDYVVILGGIDDIGGSGLNAAHVEANLQTMYTAAHNAGSKVVALTLTPFKGNNNWTACKQATHDTVNTWISTANNVDYVIDMCKVLGDPSNPTQLLPAYDSSDHCIQPRQGKPQWLRQFTIGLTLRQTLL